MARVKALTRPITRKQARSYDKTYPNGRGVTALAEVNGRGAYERRYQQTRRMLDNQENGMYTAAQKRAMKKMSPAQQRAFKKMLGRSPDVSKLRRGQKMKKNARKKTTKKATPQKRYTTNKRPSKSDFIDRQLRGGRTKKQAEAAWSLAYGRKLGAKKGKKQTRKYADKYKAVKARVGPRSRWTYKYVAGKKRKQLRDIPDHALLGFKTRRELNAYIRKIARDESPKGRRSAQALERKMTNLAVRRQRAAEKAQERILSGKGMFTPNVKETLSYEEFEDMMRPNRRRKKKKTTRKRKTRQTAAQRRASMRNIKKAQTASRRKRRKKSTKKSYRKNIKVSSRPTRVRRTMRANQGAYAHNKRKTMLRRTMRANQGAYAHNKRKTMLKNRRRKYVRNQSFGQQLMGALKLGLIVTGGYITHRALTKVVDEQVMSKIDALNKGTIGDYRTLISGVLVAAVGIPASVKLLPKQAAPVAAGMATSLIHSAIMATLKATKQEKVAGYLGAYPNAEGSTYGHAIGSYFTFTPHQVFNGMGSYYTIPQPGVAPLNGFGQDPMVTQAAAGFGQPMLTQAAAGFGQPMLTQAAAGFGQAITQAAAGTGEYIAYGTEGIGDYESIDVTMAPSSVDEGIFPNTHSAEQALSVAESAAGVGDASIPLQSTVNPTMIADPVADLPGGSRAGILAGGDGIFG